MSLASFMDRPRRASGLGFPVMVGFYFFGFGFEVLNVRGGVVEGKNWREYGIGHEGGFERKEKGRRSWPVTK